MKRSTFITRILKPALFLALLLPAASLIWRDMGANPVETITHATGSWALRLLLVTLAITPLRRLTGWGELLRLRRMLGLYAFFYALLHFLTYAVLDQGLLLSAVLEDVLERPYITLGFAVFLMLIPLAATSTDGMIRRLGVKRWRRLHRLVYPAALGGLFHFLWLVKADLREPLVHLAILLLLLAFRLPSHLFPSLAWRKS